MTWPNSTLLIPCLPSARRMNWLAMSFKKRKGRVFNFGLGNPMHSPSAPAPQTGLYRCTTCGILVPFNAGEPLTLCPSGCQDPVWTFFSQHRAKPTDQPEKPPEN